MKIEIVSKGRKYYKAKNPDTGSAFLLTRENTEFENGSIIDAEVDDISIRTKYGSKIIYKFIREIKGNFYYNKREYSIHIWNEAVKT